MMQRQDCFRLVAVPERLPNGTVQIAIADDTNDKVKHEIATFYGGTRLEFVKTDAVEIYKKIDQLYPRATSEQTPAERLLTRILITARRQRATDILFEPFTGPLRQYEEFHDKNLALPEVPPGRVRFNVENLFLEAKDPQTGRPLLFFKNYEEYERTLRVIKSRSTMNSDNDRLPSDGRMKTVDAGAQTEYRINFLPLAHGQKCVMRYIASTTEIRNVKTLSFPDTYDRVVRALTRKGTFVLIAGPTRSGKTTAAYALLAELPLTTMNVYTVEQPVEAEIPLVSQVNVSSDERTAQATEQMTMADAMRSLVRQNPDLVFLGEMRDEETVGETFKIATAGASVIATIHAHRAEGVFDRIHYLFDVESDQVRTLITMIVAQQLVRRVCRAKGCAIPLTDKALEASPDGCASCNFRGYAGEFALIDIYERNSSGEWAYTIRMEDIARRAIDEGITDEAEAKRVLGRFEDDD
jgi:type II secretory ATPase GspE/PulE/Tfp pilus assembly ATPase PilB-like protein